MEDKVRLVMSQRFDSARNPAGNAAAILPPLLAAWFIGGHKVASEAPDPTHLHQFRIEGKRLRYTMELFEPCYGPGLGRYLKLLKQSQTHLGDFQDCVAVSELLDEMPDNEPHRVRTLRFLKRKSERHYAEFQAFWTSTVAGTEQRWSAYLMRPRVESEDRQVRTDT